MSGGRRDPVKVTIIDSHYVQTDAMSFKSVVQSLTGKDSTITTMGDASFVGGKRARSETTGAGAGRSHGTSTSSSSRNLDFEELDRLLIELPPLDELHRIWVDQIEWS